MPRVRPALAALLALMLFAGAADARHRHPRRPRRGGQPAPVAGRIHVGGKVPARTLRAMDSLLAATFGPQDPGAAVLVMRGDKVLVRRGYGLRSVPGGMALAPETPFPLGAVGEQLIAGAVLQLAADGRLGIGDSLARFLPGFPWPVTVEQLLTHTSGLEEAPDLPWCPAPSAPDPVARFGHRPPRFPPGADWSENAADYALLARAIEKASGAPLSDELRRRLLDPLGMSATGCAAPAPQGYRRGAGGWSAAPAPSAGLVSTVDDLARWCDALEGDGIVGNDLLARAFTPTVLADGRSTGYGYGFALSTLNGHATIERAGSGDGFSAALLRVPDQRVVVAILANREDPGVLRTALRLAGLAIGRPWDDPAAAMLDPAQLERLAGVYTTPAGERIRVEHEGGRMYLQRGDGARAEIVAHSANEFFVPGSEVRIEFTLAPGERASRLVLPRRAGPAEIATRAEEGAGR